eukprot:TRINITY_DN2903_c0_g4_i2.p1 TRINITY_DN2903_c0_g4~~TRINITY_DN2903_c0_g4_i2.p1  ORF type:complete len:302 (-),score=72.64 TRINITY_DN2903_c0_g4_i2:1692-2597(-)
MEVKLNSGAVLGAYKIIQQVNDTSTFLAINTNTKKKVEIQQLYKDSFRYTLSKNELKLLTIANNKNIISPIEVLKDPTCIYVVQEHIEATSIKNYVNNTKLEETEVKGIMQQVVEAYQVLFGNSILHYNISPRTVFVAEKDRKAVKLAGIGILSVVKYDELYTAPEILNDHAQYNYLCDVWSIGAIMYYMLHGCAPYEINELKRGKCFIRPNITKSCYDFLYSCLQHDPLKRMTFENMKFHPFLLESEAAPTMPRSAGAITEKYHEFSDKFSKLPKGKSSERAMKFIGGISINKNRKNLHV